MTSNDFFLLLLLLLHQLLGSIYKEDHTYSNLRLLFGLVCSAVAGYAYLYTGTYPKSRDALLICCSVYYLISIIWSLFSRYIECDIIFKGQVALKSGKYEDFCVSTDLGQYDTKYVVRLETAAGNFSHIIDISTVISDSGKLLETEFFPRLQPLFANWRPLSLD